MTTVPIIAVTRDDIAEPLVDEWAGEVDPRMWDLFAEEPSADVRDPALERPGSLLERQ